jgi:AcrR family transcriptional regulator
MSTLCAVRPPRQRRSQQTLDRILDAAERLLLEREFDRLSIAEIVRASRTSVGSFYNRFRDKQALLSGLYDRYDAGLPDWIESWQRRQGAAPADLVRTSGWITRYLIDTFQGRRHLLRALALHVRNHPEELDAQARDRRVSQHRFLVDALLQHRGEILHAEPERAAQAAVFGAASICRERILFAEGAHADGTQQSNAQLLQDVARMVVGLLKPMESFDLSSV